MILRGDRTTLPALGAGAARFFPLH